jgi:hypothetical protein
METESEITGSEIYDMVADCVNKKYQGASIVKVYKIETAKGITTYETEIKKWNKKI